jgi:hypothetical protein
MKLAFLFFPMLFSVFFVHSPTVTSSPVHVATRYQLDKEQSKKKTSVSLSELKMKTVAE